MHPRVGGANLPGHAPPRGERRPARQDRRGGDAARPLHRRPGGGAGADRRPPQPPLRRHPGGHPPRRRPAGRPGAGGAGLGPAPPRHRVGPGLPAGRHRRRARHRAPGAGGGRPDRSRRGRASPTRPGWPPLGYGSLVAFPLVFEDQVLGVLEIAHPPSEGLLDCCFQVARRVASLVAIALHNSLLVDEVKRLNGLLGRENALLREELRQIRKDDRYLAESGAMKAVVAQVQKVAASDTTVLIRGETGTGKEGLARMVHDLSPRFDAPFVAVNLAAIPEGLVESELFGHEKGAFTGAVRRRAGPVRGGRRRHHLPRRGGRRAAGGAGAAAAGAAGAGADPGGRHRHGQGERARGGGHQPGAGAAGGRAAASARTSTTGWRSSRCACRRCASGAATCGRWPSTSWRATRPQMHRRPPEVPGRLLARHRGARLARQRARAGELRAAGAHPLAGPGAGAARPAGRGRARRAAGAGAGDRFVRRGGAGAASSGCSTPAAGRSTAPTAPRLASA